MENHLLRFGYRISIYFADSMDFETTIRVAGYTFTLAITMRLFFSLLSIIVCASSTIAKDYDDPFYHWPTDLTIRGKVIVGTSVGDGSALIGSLSKSELNAKVTLLVDRDLSTEEFVQYAKTFFSASDYRVVRRDPEQKFAEIARVLPECQTFLWRSTQSLDQQQWKHLLEQRADFSAFLTRGGTLVFLGPAAVNAGSIYAQDEDGELVLREGLGLLPDCLIYPGDGSESRENVSEILIERPSTVGITLAEGTLLKLTGRILSTNGPGAATLMLAGASDGIPAKSKTIAPMQSRHQIANDFLADLTQWRRQAINRQLPPFPADKPPAPKLDGGTLVIVGGGGMPKGLMNRFVELAGGVDDAKLVYVPCSEQIVLLENQSTVHQWNRMGVKNATFIHTKDRRKANSDEEFLKPLSDATGIWFGGGRQWNFSDSYYGTKAQAMMKDVLKRGGVIGGSSAGASIQASFLARATPINNYDILAPGYLRGGLGFLSGVAIDQHFTQRGRQKDMTLLVNRYPQMLGIGIDESTALIVEKSIGTVVGKGDVYFYDRTKAVTEDEPDYVKVGDGGRYELVERKLIDDDDHPNPNAAGH